MKMRTFVSSLSDHEVHLLDRAVQARLAHMAEADETALTDEEMGLIKDGRRFGAIKLVHDRGLHLTTAKILVDRETQRLLEAEAAGDDA